MENEFLWWALCTIVQYKIIKTHRGTIGPYRSLEVLDNVHVSYKQFCFFPQFVFKLTTAKHQDHYFQASHQEERDAWVKDLKKAAKCIADGQKFARKSTRKSIRLPDTINLG